MNRTTSDYALEQRYLLEDMYRNARCGIEINNAMCAAFIKTKQKSLYDFFLKNPRITRAYGNEYVNTFTPLSLGVRDLHSQAARERMVDPIVVNLVRARVVVQVTGKKYPIRQDVIWDKSTRTYFDNEFKKGRLNLSDQHSEFLVLVIKQVNQLNQTILSHYRHFLELQNLLENNEIYLGGRYD
ncbi:hypothetical protein [Vibrio alfacsensis]|uniref:hypothetical protein n=1 Tax=Vibrio alfacsensis TaxID=1074311 RepID=UPI0040688748